MNSFRLLVVTVCLQLCGCGYTDRDVEHIQCDLPYQLRNVELRFSRDKLEFGVTDPVRDLRGATIIPDTLRLEDYTGRACRISLSNDPTVYNERTPSGPERGKVDHILFAFQLERPKGANYALAEGDYTLRLSLIHQGATYPLVCRFSLVDRTKHIKLSKL